LNLPQLFSSIDDWQLSLNYTYLNARFLDSFATANPEETNESEGAARESENKDGDGMLVVTRGDRLSGIPEHIFKAAITVNLWKKLTLGINGQYSGEQVFRGDEANTQPHLAGYWLFNMTADYKFNKNFSVFGKLDNIFDARYNSFGVYGNASEVLGSQYNDGRFVSPGAPLGAWIGVRLSL
jgi:outer membrane receptor for monomeric catechols